MIHTVTKGVDDNVDNGDNRGQVRPVIMAYNDNVIHYVIIVQDRYCKDC